MTYQEKMSSIGSLGSNLKETVKVMTDKNKSSLAKMLKENVLEEDDVDPIKSIAYAKVHEELSEALKDINSNTPAPKRLKVNPATPTPAAIQPPLLIIDSTTKFVARQKKW